MLHVSPSDLDPQTLWLAVEASPLLVIISNPDGRVRYVNPAFEQVSGFDRDDVIGRPVDAVTARGELNEATFERLTDAIAAQQTFTERLPKRRRTGELYWTSSVITPVVDRAGATRHVIEIAQDVTEREALAQHLEVARARAVAGEQAKSAFLAHMSHEIRSPLTALIGFAQLIADESAEGRSRERADTIISTGHHLLDVVNDVLELSRLEAGQIDLDVSCFHPLELVRDVEHLFTPMLRPGVRLWTSVSPRTPTTVRGDQVKLRQVIHNLISNAVRLTEDGCVLVVVDTAAAPSGGERVRVLVADTGPGIGPKDQARIFTAFDRGSAPTGRGTGLGLAVSQRYARAMGGQITVQSQLGVGAVFTFEWATQTSELATSPTAVDHEATRRALHALPEAQQRKLRRAIADGDIALVLAHIEAIDKRHPATAARLNTMARAYAFDELLELLPAGQAEEPPVAAPIRPAARPPAPPSPETQGSMALRIQRFEQAQRVAQLGSWHLDVATGAIDWSRGIYRLFGVPDHVKMTYERFLALIHPDDRERVASAWTAALHGATYAIDHRVVLPDGQVRWMRERAVIRFGVDGRAAEADGTVQDVTSEHNFEARYRQTIDSAIQGFWRVNMQGRIIEANRSAAEMLGYTVAQLEGMWVSDIDVLDDQAKVERQSRRIGDGERLVFDTTHERSDGTLIPVRVSGLSARDTDGTIVVFVEDLSEQNAVLAELKRYQQHLEDQVSRRTRDLERTARDFADANMALRLQSRHVREARDLAEHLLDEQRTLVERLGHEVRTPMTTILGRSELLLADASLPEAVRVHVQAIFAAASGATARLDHALADRPTERERFDLSTLLGELREDTEHRARRHGVALNWTQPTSLPQWLDADGDQVRVVTRAVLEHALHASSENMQVTVSRVASDGDTMFRVEVEDTGPTLTPAAIHRLFLSATYRSELRRVGDLGIARSVARTLGGDLTATPTDDGVRFTFTFAGVPAEAPSADDERPAPSAAPPSPPAPLAPTDREALRAAIEEGDLDRFEAILDEIGPTRAHDPLRAAARAYRFDQLLTLLAPPEDHE